MTTREKILQYKDIIYKLYSIEGRNKSYISKLLDVDRKILGEIINNEWKFEKAQKHHFNPSNQKILNANRNLIIKLINKNMTLNEIAEYTSINKSLIATFLKYDTLLSTEWNRLQDERKRMAIQNKELKIADSYLNYDFQDLEGEQWKPIENFESYMVSNYGRVKNYKPTHDKFVLRKTTKNKQGYVDIDLFDNNKRKNVKIHRLVAEAFCPKDSIDKVCVNHMDGDKTNNHYSNLEWVTYGENNKHAYDMLNRKKNRINKMPYKKIIYNDKYEFKTIVAFAKFLNKSETQTRRYLENPSKYNMNIKTIM